MARRLVRRYLPRRLRQTVFSVRHLRRSAATSRGSQPVDPRPRDRAESLVQDVRDLLAAGQTHPATSLTAALRNEPETAALGAVTGAIVAFHGGYLGLAWKLFEDVPRELWRRHAASEYLRTAITADRSTATDEVRLLLTDPPGCLDARSWSDVLGAVYGVGDEALSREVFAAFDRAVGDGTAVPADLVVTRDWMRQWVAASADSPSAPDVPAGHVSFAIMDYGHPGRTRASANIGDHVQSIASLGHVVRHQDLRFHGPQDVVRLLEQLRGRVRTELRLTGVPTDVDVITVNRDASMYKEVPRDTWILCFGWFMHAIFGLRFGFPLHRNLLPIFLSFHCNKRELLTPEALDYLRRYGPVGCRDWTTVDTLLSLDVPAFFSGCLTTTINTVFPDLPKGPPKRAGVAYVDMPREAVPEGAAVYRHSTDAVRVRNFTDNVQVTLEQFETYRRRHSGLVTTRLHCWLPGRSIGIPVEFLPKNPADIRFAGLIDTTDAEFHAIRDSINAKLEHMLTAILSGEEPSAVYERWRELNADDVAAARRRHEAAPAPAERVDIADDVARVVATTRTRPGAAPAAADDVHLVVHLFPGGGRTLPVLVESVQRHRARGVHLWIVTREPDDVDDQELATLFPEIAISVVPTRGLGTDVLSRHSARVRPRDLDLLLLSELLPSVDRVVVLPVDAVCSDDLAELVDMDLGTTLLAAPTVVGTAGSSGFGVIHHAAMRLGDNTVAATELRRRAYARHTFDFDAFTTDVFVLDLATCRSEGFVSEFLPYVDQFGLTLRQVLHFAAGPHRTVIPERWDCVPTRSVVDQPGLVHWADPGKPWDESYTAEQQRWLEIDQAVQARRLAR